MSNQSEVRKEEHHTEGTEATEVSTKSGHSAGVASQTPCEDPARVGNYAPGSIAGLCQGTFRLSEPRRMVLSFCRGPGSIHALKSAEEFAAPLPLYLVLK